MKICLVDTRDQTRLSEAGAVYVSELAPALAEHHQVSVVTVGDRPHEQPAAGGAIRKVVERERPDLVHLNNIAGLPLLTVMWAIGGHLPVAASLHDGMLLRLPVDINRWLISRVRLVISPTHSLLDRHLERGFFRQAIRQIVPYGIEAAPPPSARPHGGAFDVFFLDPSMSRDMRRARLQTADCLVLPSREPDQYLLTVQEALQAGAVVIGGRAGGISEVIQSGVNGILVEAGDHAAIDASIRQLHDDPVLATRLRTAAAETARHFDMRFHVAGLSDAYRQLIRASRAGELDRPAA